MNGLDQLLDELADRLAPRLAERLRGGAASDLVDQSSSPLGNRRHIQAVRRRMAAGELGASKVGRRYLLNREALSEELQRSGVKPQKPAEPTSAGVRSELERELRLVRGQS